MLVYHVAGGVSAEPSNHAECASLVPLAEVRELLLYPLLPTLPSLFRVPVSKSCSLRVWQIGRPTHTPTAHGDRRRECVYAQAKHDSGFFSFAGALWSRRPSWRADSGRWYLSVEQRCIVCHGTLYVVVAVVVMAAVATDASCEGPARSGRKSTRRCMTHGSSPADPPPHHPHDPLNSIRWSEGRGPFCRGVRPSRRPISEAAGPSRRTPTRSAARCVWCYFSNVRARDKKTLLAKHTQQQQQQQRGLTDFVL